MTRAALAVELAKLRAQPLPRLLLLLCALGPFALVLVLSASPTLPTDTLFGRYVRDSGLAVPLFLLGVAGQWLLPLLVAVVTGDLFGAEDRHRTWGTLLTRGCDRPAVFRAKVLAAAGWTALVVAVLAGASTLAGLLLGGSGPLVGLSGQDVGTGRAVALVLLAWAAALPPALALAALAVLLSVAFRSSVAGVLGPVVVALVLLLAALAPLPHAVRVAVLATAVPAWHGLLLDPVALGPVLTGAAVSAVWCGLALAAAAVLHLERDVVVA